MCVHAVCIFLSEVIILTLNAIYYFWLNANKQIIKNVYLLFFFSVCLMKLLRSNYYPKIFKKNTTWKLAAYTVVNRNVLLLKFWLILLNFFFIYIYIFLIMYDYFIWNYFVIFSANQFMLLKLYTISYK